MIDHAGRWTVRGAAHPYLSDTAIDVLEAEPQSGWVEIDGSLALFDISGFTVLTERLARLGRGGAEHINDLLNDVFEPLIDDVFAGGGDVLEFGGDAMVVLFSGGDHELRAATTAARMLKRIAGRGALHTPAGDARVRMSCGIASGRQAYHVVGSTRRALVIAGAISSEMALLGSFAKPGTIRINKRVASALPSHWIESNDDDSLRLRLGRITIPDRQSHAPRRAVRSSIDVEQWLPAQLRGLSDMDRGAGELKEVAIAFLRLDGTDDVLAAHGVDALGRHLGAVTDVVDQVSAELNVCWLETQTEVNGMRWTLIAGAPDATERDGERLLRVLRRIADESPAPLRIGANLGVVYVGDMGHPERCTYIVMGDATNLAARLMARAAPGEVVVGERLYGAGSDRFAAEWMDPFVVKGKRLPVRAVRLGALSESRLANEVLRSERSRMVGREIELSRVRSAIASAATVDLVGEAGAGKTRLWREAERTEGHRTWLTVWGEPYESELAFGPFRRAIRAYARVGVNSNASVTGAALSTLVTARAPELLPMLPLIADVVGADVSSTVEADSLDPAFRAGRMEAVTAAFVLRLVGPGGVVVIDDVHWLDESSRRLIDVMCRSADRSAAIVTTRRPGTWAPPDAVTVELSAIDDGAADQLLLDNLPPSAASDATLARLRRSAGGSPFYLIELARSVADARATNVFDDIYPVSIERLLTARIDSLSVSGRRLVRDASVLGSSFSRALASKVLARPELMAGETWSRELGDLMIVDGGDVRFRHDLVRTAAYQGLSIRRRRAVHARAVVVIDEWGSAAPVVDPIAALAFHASGSGDDDNIVRWCAAAADAALGAGAMEIGESLLAEVSDAQRRLGVDPAVRSATLRRQAMAAERSGHPEKALAILGQAARLADPDERPVVAVDRARLQEKLGRYRAALATTTRALSQCSDPGVRGHLLLSRATLWNFQSRWRACLDLCREILSDSSYAADRRLLAQAHLLAEWCCTALGLGDRAAHAQAALDLMTEVDDSIGLANLLLNRGESAWRENRPSDAISDFRTSSALYTRAGDVLGAALADNNLAEVLTLQFHLDEAERLLVHARRVAQAANYPHGTLATISGLSRIAAWRGNIDTAIALQSEAVSGFRDLRADDFVADGLVRLVEIHVIAGDVSALDVAGEAQRAVQRLGNVPVLSATLGRLRARALLAAGRTDEARVGFERARAAAQLEGFAYEEILAALGLARLDGDQGLVASAFTRLAQLGVLAPPPGS